MPHVRKNIGAIETEINIIPRPQWAQNKPTVHAARIVDNTYTAEILRGEIHGDFQEEISEVPHAFGGGNSHGRAAGSITRMAKTSKALGEKAVE